MSVCDYDFSDYITGMNVILLLLSGMVNEWWLNYSIDSSVCCCGDTLYWSGSASILCSSETWYSRLHYAFHLHVLRDDPQPDMIISHKNL